MSITEQQALKIAKQCNGLPCCKLGEDWIEINNADFTRALNLAAAVALEKQLPFPTDLDFEIDHYLQRDADEYRQAGGGE